MNLTANIVLFSSEGGGRFKPLPSDAFRCVVFFVNKPELGGKGYDCRLLNTKRHIPGSQFSCSVKFLSQAEVASVLSVGDQFVLWEAKAIGIGTVLLIESHES